MSSSLVKEIKKAASTVFRRAYVRRRALSDGRFEADWVEITSDVKKWGTLKLQVDATRYNKFNFGSFSLVVANDQGKFNPEDDDSSLWYGYGSQQRSLIKIECGFVHSTLSSSGIWQHAEYPATSLWDQSTYDAHYNYDDLSVAFVGIISGDINISDANEVHLPVKPLQQIFRDYAARNLTGYDNSMTASRFMEMLRDQTDGSGNFIFRPFFGDTTSNWEISTTTAVYANLNTGTAEDVRDMNVWDVIERLAEAETYVPYVTRSGVFKFTSREPNTSTVAYEFHGLNSFDRDYGHTIKRIERYGRKISKFYSRVSLKWKEENTATSYEVRQTTLTVEGDNPAWNYGERTLAIENTWIPTLTVAETVADAVFFAVASAKNEITFQTSFIPHLELFDPIKITYDSSNNFNTRNLWDLNNWADDATNTSTDLIFDQATGDAIRIIGKEFKFQAIEVNLDNLECRFEAREV